MHPKKPPRKQSSQEIETSVLANSARRCALCFHLDGDLSEKHGQIAHLDQNRSNSIEDNLVFMCLPHHSLYDSTTSQHKNYTLHEVKSARANLYKLVAQGKHLNASALLPYAQMEADKRILHDLLEIVPSNGSINFLRTKNFAGWSFELNRLEQIETFFHERNGPEHEFLDSELEEARQNFRTCCGTALSAIAVNTFPTDTPGWQSLPEDWEFEFPKRFRESTEAIHSANEAVCQAYDNLVRLARRKLAV